jgi:transcriptional regulator with XRE-family HTH domain
MTFAEKIRELRNNKGLSQTELGKAIGVSLRTVRNWELEGRYPKQRELYGKLAEVLECDINYLMAEDAIFVSKAEEDYGNQGRQGAQKIMAQVNSLFSGGSLAEEDMDAFVLAVQQAYIDAKKKKTGKKSSGSKSNKDK